VTCRPRAFAVCAIFALLGLAASARANDAQSFVQTKRAELERIARQPVSPERDAELSRALREVIDYDALTRRAFGEPCHPSLRGCDDLWATYDADQQREVRDLLEQVVERNYRNELFRTLDFDISYRGQREEGSDMRVVTEARDRSKPREPPVRVDLVLEPMPNGWRVVDIVTEGSSLTRNYYEQFRRIMHEPNEGYRTIVAKLHAKIAKLPPAMPTLSTAIVSAQPPAPPRARSIDWGWLPPPLAVAGTLAIALLVTGVSLRPPKGPRR
jgi:ABC-type transporter MlaC component